MTTGGKLLLAVLGVLSTAPAQAGDKQDFEACDGRIHPGKQDDGMRGLAGSQGWAGSFGRGTSIDACTRALASPRLLPTQTLRRAHLLRARAAAHAQAGDSAAALGDLDAAQAVLGSAATNPFIARSFGVSLSLMRALLLGRAGDFAAAVPLARSAAAARPYSLEVQQIAATVLQAARPLGDASASPWTPMARLNPQTGASALISEAEIGNFAGVLALRPGVAVEWPIAPVTPLGLTLREPTAVALLTTTIVSLHTAYARAATGDPAGARRDLAEVRLHAAAVRPAADAKPSALAAMVSVSDSLGKYVETRGRQIEARIAVAEKRPSEAIAALVATAMPRDAATLDLLAAIKAATPAQDAALVPDLAPFQTAMTDQRRTALLDAIPSALIAPETPRAVLDYSRARPNILGALVGAAFSMGTTLLGGIQRTDGFRSTPNPDGTIKVEFIGNTPSAALVQEMTLLRAAEVARAAGKPNFVITERKEYARSLVTTRYGAQISSTPTGFKSELTIRPVAAGVEPARAFDAVAIIDALGPLYYEEKPKTAAAS